MVAVLKRKRAVDVDMTEGSILGHLVTFALPLLVGNIFQMLYNMVDTFVVGQFVSDTAFAAVGSLGSVTNLMVGFFSGFASGAGVVISKAFGSHKDSGVKDSVSTAVAMTLTFSIVFTVLGFFLITPFLSILDMPDDVAREARTYLTIWYSGISGLMIYNMGAGIMRAVGDSRRPFIMLVICAVMNTVLDLIFVLVFGMGVDGVAYATVLSQGLSALLVTVLLFRTDSAARIDIRNFRVDFKILATILKIGLPTALRMAITSFSNIFVQSYINEFGTAGMGGWSAYNKIDLIVLQPMQSISLASTTFVGQNLGAGNVKRAEKGVNTALMLSLSVTAVLIIPIVAFPGGFVSIFNTNPDIIEYGSLFLRLMTPFYIVMCINMIYAGALQGAGNTLPPMVIMLLSYVALRQVYLYVVSNYISNSPIAISFGFPFGWCVAALLTFVYYRYRRLDKTL